MPIRFEIAKQLCPILLVIIVKQTPARAFDAEPDSLALQYYFDGTDIAYRRTSVGVEVVAVGLEEVGELIRTTPQEQREGVVFGQG